jgi:polar amino acid transport system substrate-binding protein
VKKRALCGPVRAAFLLAASSLLASTPSPAGPTLNQIKQTGHIKLGYVGDALPFSFRASSGPDGYAIALCEHVADSLEKQFALQKLTRDWTLIAADRALRQTEARAIDLLCAPTSVSLRRRERVSFSLPIFAGGNRAVIRADASSTLREGLAKQRISKGAWRGTPAANLLEKTSFAAMKGTTTAKWLEEQRNAYDFATNIQFVGDYRAGLRRVVDGKVDVFFGERSLILGALGTEEAATRQNLVVVERMFTQEALALAMPRGDDEFRVAVDRALSQLYASEGFKALYTKWCGAVDPPTEMFFQIVELAE